MSDLLIIGIDHGFSLMKSSHFSFPTGLVAYDHEPYTRKDVLEYGGRYYVVGSGRQPIQREKTLTDDYYLMTLAMIAREIAYRRTPPMANLYLAVGLPLTDFGRDKEAFEDYLSKNGKPVSFRFEDQEYTISVREIEVFPQGYAAALYSGMLTEPSMIVADIGGWTVDLMRVDRQIPDASTSASLEMGMIRCLNLIMEVIRRDMGISMTSVQIESVLRGEGGHVDEQAEKIIHREAGKYVHALLSSITEHGLDIRAIPVIFLGGGAALLKTHVPRTDRIFRPIILDDITMNAKAYELLAGKAAGRRQGV